MFVRYFWAYMIRHFTTVTAMCMSLKDARATWHLHTRELARERKGDLRGAVMQKQTSVITCVPQTRQDREFQLRSEAQRRRRAREREMRERAREDTACAAAGVTLAPSTYSGDTTPTFSVARSCHEVAELEAIRACLDLRRTLIRWAVTELEGLLVEVDREAASTELLMDQQLEQRLQRSMSRVIATLDRSQALVAAVRDEPSACTCNGAP